jgi:hypothetical protein
MRLPDAADSQEHIPSGSDRVRVGLFSTSIRRPINFRFAGHSETIANVPLGEPSAKREATRNSVRGGFCVTLIIP